MAVKNRKFKTEVQQLLDLVIHSLYSKKEIFLRELISNASDAIDRARFEALTDKDLLQDGEDWKIRIAVDKDARTITISDNGVGMTADEVDQNIGTIANSGTKAFLTSLQGAQGTLNPEFIGQFGVGFYSSFMVADRVTLITRRAGKDQEAVQWVSAGDGAYTLEPGGRSARGTDVILHLREGMDEFLDEWKIREVVKAYSDYIAYPIVMEVAAREKGKDAREDATLNSLKAIWKKAKGEVTDAEYTEFYRHICHDFTEPLRVVHFFAEGSTEFRALLYIPGQASMDLFLPGRHRGVHLYVRNVFITDDCKELLPAYLRFVKGVVDSSDLPLNVSREMLQDDAIIRRIRKNLVSRILKELKELQDKQPAEYATFFRQFGRVLKEGVFLEPENADKIKDLLLFPTNKTDADQLLSLREYVGRMPSDQKEIYALSGESLDAARHSPLLEAFHTRGYEVLLFVDPMDEWMAPHLTEYDGKPLRAIDRGTLDLGTEEEKKQAEAQLEQSAREHRHLLDWMQARLKDDIKDVRFSTRLTGSACCLVTDEDGINANMERVLRAMNQPVPHVKRILELNPAHPVLARMEELFAKDKENPRLADYADLLYGQALLAEGSSLKDPVRFTSLVSDLMVSAGG